jgi:hypothetical protein
MQNTRRPITHAWAPLTVIDVGVGLRGKGLHFWKGLVHVIDATGKKNWKKLYSFQNVLRGVQASLFTQVRSP